jgi:hypothetical protein
MAAGRTGSAEPLSAVQAAPGITSLLVRENAARIVRPASSFRLRHSFAKHPLEDAFDAWTFPEFLGHSEIRDHYGLHACPERWRSGGRHPLDEGVASALSATPSDRGDALTGGNDQSTPMRWRRLAADGVIVRRSCPRCLYRDTRARFAM